ncbi:MAG: primosomal protein N' [Porticoccaceae bacterium]
MSAPLFYQIAVPSPLRRLFDYLPPAEVTATLLPGLRVRVPFGRRTLIGVVVSNSATSAIAAAKLKPIAEVLDPTPLLPPALLQLYLWAASYYQTPPGEALAATLPVLLRQGNLLPPGSELHWQLTTHGLGLAPAALQRSPRQHQILQLLQPGTEPGTTPPRLTAAALDTAGIARTALRELIKKGLVEAVQIPAEHAAFDTTALLAEDHLSLHPDQQTALAAINLHGYHSYLLQGETGSGKTEIYLQAIEKILRYGRQALVLVPEISLTPQTLRRFRNRFQCPIAVIHSGLTDRERLQAWHAAANGTAGVVIGTRSAVFTPLRNPGILIVDEEHDPSFKQQDGFRYSARDVAVMRANREGIPIILGSATPALESLHNCEQGRYQRLILRGRPGPARQPRWQLVDIRKTGLQGGFSAVLIAAIRQELDSGNQVLVFINRRGFAPTLLCHDCGWIAACLRCETRLTLHRTDPGLLCHHCEYRQTIPHQCPHCHSKALRYLGQGTERGEDVLAALFPQTPVIRVDRDSTRRKTAMADVVERMDAGAPCILVGTQILAKGHHFPGVTLVAIVDADSGLFSPDFRALERMGQLLVQVAGRAGRGSQPGTVMLQSHHCDHPLITLLTQRGYPAFADHILAERRLAGLPPFAAMALIRAEDAMPDSAIALLRHARALCGRIQPASPEFRYLGPVPAPLEKRNRRYRYQLYITALSRTQLQRLLAVLAEELEASPLPRRVRWSIDVDPQDTQ